MINKFLSCDWGTSSLRIRLIRSDELEVLSEVTSHKGIGSVYKEWLGKKAQGDIRHTFYLNILKEEIKKLESETSEVLSGIPLVISGMASSSLGIKELAYKLIPVNIDSNDVLVERISSSTEFEHDILIISGIRTERDVIRGEETQLIGAISDDHSNQLCIMPGTHSKHVFLENRRITDFHTYMTGEFFQLLSEKSSLSNTINGSVEIEEVGNKKSFIEGVHRGLSSNILNEAFQTRAGFLLGSSSETQNYHFLSGLLIGAEVKELKGYSHPVTVVGNDEIKKLMQYALNEVGLTQVSYKDSAEVTIKGQYLIAKRADFL